MVVDVDADVDADADVGADASTDADADADAMSKQGLYRRNIRRLKGAPRH